MKLLFSIIVPIYNVEKYLNQCIDSIINQSYKHLEIILVDDGSSDNSGAICDKYAASDKRIKVIHKANGGLSSARNSGLKEASGNYIIFIDSDDYYYRLDCIEKIAATISSKNADVVVIPPIHFDDEKSIYTYKDKKYLRSEVAEHNKEDALKYAFKYDFFKACAWDKAVKSEIIFKNKMFFIDGLFSEDIDWCAMLVNYISSLDCLEEPMYAYRQRNGSITKSLSCKHISDILYQIEKWAGSAKKSNDNIMLGYLAHNYVMLLEVYSKVSASEKRKYLDKIKTYSYLLKYDYSLNVKKVKRVYSILGLYATLFILKTVRK